MEGHQQIVSALAALKDDLDQRHRENVTSQAVTDAKVTEAIRRIDDLHRGFPDGDPDAHCRYHEILIKKAEARADFYMELRAELAKKGMWALIVLLGLALWQYIKSKVTA